MPEKLVFDLSKRGIEVLREIYEELKKEDIIPQDVDFSFVDFKYIVSGKYEMGDIDEELINEIRKILKYEINERVVQAIESDIKEILRIANKLKNIDYGIVYTKTRGLDYDEVVLSGREFYDLFYDEFTKSIDKFLDTMDVYSLPTVEIEREQKECLLRGSKKYLEVEFFSIDYLLDNHKRDEIFLFIQNSLEKYNESYKDLLLYLEEEEGIDPYNDEELKQYLVDNFYGKPNSFKEQEQLSDVKIEKGGLHKQLGYSEKTNLADVSTEEMIRRQKRYALQKKGNYADIIRKLNWQRNISNDKEWKNKISGIIEELRKWWESE